MWRAPAVSQGSHSHTGRDGVIWSAFVDIMRGPLISPGSSVGSGCTAPPATGRPAASGEHCGQLLDRSGRELATGHQSRALGVLQPRQVEQVVGGAYFDTSTRQ